MGMDIFRGLNQGGRHFFAGRSPMRDVNQKVYFNVTSADQRCDGLLDSLTGRSAGW